MPLMSRVTLELEFDTEEKAIQWSDAIKAKAIQVRDDELLPAWIGANIGVQEIFFGELTPPDEEIIPWVP